MKRYFPILKEQYDMQYWKGNGQVGVNKFPTITGLNGWQLKAISGSGDNTFDFSLMGSGFNFGETIFDKKTKDGKFVYSIEHVQPTIIAYRGEGANAEEFSQSLGFPVLDVSINGSVGFAIPIKEAVKIVKKFFPNLQFSFDQNWNKFIVNFK